ncbi:MAG: Gfo/Idh/MocA family oxidoreductase [Anaerolineae bacterium]|nr:MAG: Gfo/Idh/MocA family oxidoreductase [Anaerolineae bacterium]
MSAQLKAGVIGLGILGSQHAQFLDDQPEVEVTAVADIRRDKAEAVSGHIGAQPYTDYERMLNEHRLDIAVVATPDPLHRDPVLAAIKTGVPTVIEEKPMATAVADAEEMLEAAERAGARIFLCFSNRGSPLDRATYYVIRQGLLGEIVYGEMRLDDNICVPTQMWGARSHEWAAGSSTAHFLLSHVVDFLRWVLAPAEVTHVYAISQQKVLGYTPDLYDAFLTFDNSAKFRVKAEWVKHIDGLVEFALSFSGSEGTLTYIKRPGFGEVEGWRANVSDRITNQALLAHQEKLLAQGINLRALLHRPSPTAGELKAGGGELKRGLEALALPQDWWRLPRGFIDAVLEDTLTPSSWAEYGPLPTGVDGLRQTQIVCAIVESAERGQAIEL